MVTRWEITKAVRRSDLPAPSRLVMFVLADVAEVGTAEIPAKFTPSLRVLAEETGLDRSTVKRHLAALEVGGWLVRVRPDVQAQREGERTRYRLALPADAPEVGAESAQGVGAQDPGVGAEGGRTVPPVGAESAQGGRTVRHQERQISSDQNPAPTVLPATPAGASITQRSKRITDAYAAAEPMCRWPAINGVVIKAIKSGRFTDGEIHAALQRLAVEGRSVTVETLRVELSGIPPGTVALRPNGHAPPRPSTTDRAVAAGLALGAKFAEREPS